MSTPSRPLLSVLPAAVACALLLTASPTASGATTEEPVPVPVRVGTYNIIASVSPATFEEAVEQLSGRVDVAGLQEVNSKDKEAALATMDGWGYFRAERDRGEQNPVIWDEGVFSFVSARSVRVAKASYVGNEVPGKDGHIKPHYATVVRLQHVLTGQAVSVVNIHLPPGAVKAGVPVPGRPRLFRRYARELERIAEVTRTEASWGRVFVTGDFNVGWVADEKRRHDRLPFKTFRRMSMPSMWATERPADRGTRQDALLDQVYSPDRATSASVAFDLKYSDHRPGIAAYLLEPEILP